MKKNLSGTETVKARLEEHLQVMQELLEDHFLERIYNASQMIAECLGKGNKVLLCGNGGSAADAQHTAAELVGRFNMERNPLPAISLNTNTSVLTALGNDYDYSVVFEKQVEAFGSTGDVLVGISTSGMSESVLKAMRAAEKSRMSTIALTGKGGGLLREQADLVITIPSEETPRIQEGHTTVLHIICELVESALFGKS